MTQTPIPLPPYRLSTTATAAKTSISSLSLLSCLSTSDSDSCVGHNFIRAPPLTNHHPRLRPRAEVSRCCGRQSRIAGFCRGNVVALRATMASWQAIEGEAGSDGEAQNALDNEPQVRQGNTEVAVAGDRSKGPRSTESEVKASDRSVVLIEQEGPTWTEIVWDEVRSSDDTNLGDDHDPIFQNRNFPRTSSSQVGAQALHPPTRIQGMFPT